MSERHPVDELQELLDGRLAPARRAAVEAHVASCDRCRGELDALRHAKSRVAASPGPEVPADLTARLRQALDEEDAQTGHARGVSRPGVARPGLMPWAGWLAAAATIVLALVWIGIRSGSTPVESAVADFRAFTSGTLPLDTRTEAPAALESRLQQAELGFPTRVFDFGMMDYRLVGGGLHQVGRERSALFAYRGSDDLALVCQMYRGTVADLPPPDDRRTIEGIVFTIYRQGDLTAVFWQEGAVVCVLVANGDPEAAIRLAVAKAEPV